MGQKFTKSDIEPLVGNRVYVRQKCYGTLPSIYYKGLVLDVTETEILFRENYQRRTRNIPIELILKIQLVK